MKNKLNANIFREIIALFTKYNIIRNFLIISKFLNSKKKNFVYVSLGDSSVEGIGASHPGRSYTGIIHEHLKLVQKNTSYHNLGKAGANVHDVIEKQLKSAIELQPTLITLSIGTNDLKQHTPLKVFNHDLEFLLKTLKKQTSAEIIINNIPPLMYAPAIPKYLRGATGILVSRINQGIKNIAEKTNVLLVDLYKQSLIFVRDYPEAVSKDGFHPSDFGYAIWANTIISEIDHLFATKNRPLFR